MSTHILSIIHRTYSRVVLLCIESKARYTLMSAWDIYCPWHRQQIIVGRSDPSALELSILNQEDRVRMLPTPLRNLGKFVYPTLSKSLGNRDASGISEKDDSRSQPR